MRRPIVIIPCWRRPAFLAATLRLIERARGADRMHYLFALDRGAHPAIVDVIATFKIADYATVSRKHAYAGNSFNVLEAYKTAARQLEPEDLVYLIEEDIFVAEDFFEFHQDAHMIDPAAFFVSACKGQRKIFDGDTPSILYRSDHYQSLGVSMQARRVGSFVQHAMHDYYKDMTGYCSKHLADSQLPAWAAEQDGVIHRVVRRVGGYGLFPAVPRAFHAGFIGYNRGGNDHTIDQTKWRPESERLLTMTADQMNQLANSNYRDIEHCELIRSRVSLRLV